MLKNLLTIFSLLGATSCMVFPPTNLPNGLISGVPAITADEVVRLDQLIGSGSTPPLAPRCIFNNETQFTSTGSVAQDVYSYTNLFLPFAGDRFVIRACGRFAATGNSKTISLTIGGMQSVVFQKISTGNNVPWQFECLVYRGNANINGNLSGTFTIDTDVTSVVSHITDDIWTAIVFALNVQGGATADVIVNNMTIDYNPSVLTN